jgi:hypothetical protein
MHSGFTAPMPEGETIGQRSGAVGRPAATGGASGERRGVGPPSEPAADAGRLAH